MVMSLGQPYAPVAVQVSRLRRKIEDDPKRPGFITTVRGGGHLFDPSSAQASATNST
ncbi:MAG: hypothetical protein CMM08_05635 [Rhodospirillaceae bacterium]|nr:hypothetical protein [Rhodospirillaceae bacterium]